MFPFRSNQFPCATPPDWPRYMAELAGRASHPSLRRFYEQGIVSGETPLSRTPFVAMDFETTGLDPQRHGIVSIGLVPFTLARIRCREACYWEVRPRRPLFARSIGIHRITHQDVSHAPDLSEILDDLLDALAGRVAVVHYRAIERRFLDRAVRTRLGEGLVFPVVDTMAIEAGIVRSGRGGWLRRLFARRPVSLRLAQCRSRYNLPLYGPHHALTDALATAELFQALVATHFGAETPVADLWL